MLVDVSLHKFADRGNKFTVGDTNDLQPQIKKLVESERRVRLALGEGDACDQGAECVQTIPPRLRTRRTHARELVVGIGVAGFTCTWRW